jgi:hypothetical protein
MSKTVHSVKLQAYDSIDLNRLSFSNGDVVFDDTNNTLRIMDGNTIGGSLIASQPWVSAQLSTINQTLANPNFALLGVGVASFYLNTSAPQPASDGWLAVCDGDGWNPGNDGLQHLMIYLNGAWVKVV